MGLGTLCWKNCQDVFIRVLPEADGEIRAQQQPAPVWVAPEDTVGAGKGRVCKGHSTEASALNPAGGPGPPVQSAQICYPSRHDRRSARALRVLGWGVGPTLPWGGWRPAACFAEGAHGASVCLKRTGWCGHAARSGCSWTVLQSREGR